MFDNMDKGDFRPFGKPVVDIKINGEKILDWIDFKVDINGVGDIDSFSVKFPWDVSDNPQNKLLYSGSKQSSVIVNGSADISISAGFENEDIKNLIEGRMDNAKWNFDYGSGETVEINGRSFAGALFDFKETVKYQNLTACDAIEKMATQHGLNTIMPVKTSALIGEYINDDHSTVTRETSHWDYALYLGENEGFVNRVRGKDWFFGPLEMLSGYNLDPLQFSWGNNIKSGLNFERAPNAARNLNVEVISWQSGSKKSKGQRIVEKASLDESSDGTKYTIRRYIPNITREQAKRQSDNILKQLSKEQIMGSFSCDFFSSIDNDRRIVLYGVGQGISQIYFATKIGISGSASNGLSCNIDFSNLPLSD